MNRMTREMAKSMPSRKHHRDYEYPSSPIDRDLEAKQLRKRIIESFAGVTLGAGIGLWEAQAIDDRENDEVRLACRRRDETEDWSKLRLDTLQRCNSSPSFLDAEGFRFHLPAFMLSELEGRYGFAFFLSLIHNETLEFGRFELLDRVQRTIVRDYLIFISTDPDNAYFRDDIMDALNNYWTE
ncbi:DUF6714 family protein [Haloferula chungangensis]|uniref:DUF6714 family protein n=1 Tax=Haloferula chungangensis TaxID=1048331 RepID=A0ABW2L9E8_9BACT